ncbi:MAG: hypothetical protein KBG84_11935 [Planctomycetes bacterium]|nr:hypothetical protein [Planctomycetota bacterium]
MLARATLTCLALNLFVAMILAGPAAPEPTSDLAAQYAEWRTFYSSLTVDKDSKTLSEDPRRLRCSPDGKVLLVAGT